MPTLVSQARRYNKIQIAEKRENHYVIRNLKFFFGFSEVSLATYIPEFKYKPNQKDE